MKSTQRLFAAGLLLALPNLALTQALAANDGSDVVQTVAEDSKQAEVEAPENAKPVWSFENSDIEVDDGYVFGQLDNGMRYILRQNGTPEGTVLVRMRISSGSLEETASERGLSHFLEHMAFNGSTNISEGEMIKLLEREGLAFGADTNAATGLETVTYSLDLPRNDEALLDTALMLMRETASELTIAEDAVERERGVIQAELRVRRNFAQRAQEDMLEFLAPDARFPKRFPGGTDEVIANATAAQIRALYERTYTPFNTTIVIVGDYPVEAIEAKLRAQFSDWAGGPGPKQPQTGPFDTERDGQTDIYLDPALDETTMLVAYNPWIDEPDTVANRNKQGLRAIGYAIVNRRLARLASGEDAPFRGAGFGTNNLFEDARETSLTINTADGEWKKGTLAAVRELHQAMTYGFTEAEIKEQLASLRTSRENAVKSAETRSNGAYVGGALRLVGRDRVPTTPAYRLAQLEAFERLVTPTSVFNAMREHSATFDNPLIRFQGRNAPEGGEESLRTAFAEAMALPIAAPEDNGPIVFGYDDFGTPGEVVEDSVEDKLGIRQIRFANGVRLNLKKTDIREDRISVRVSLDGGDLLVTKDDPLKIFLASSITAGGLGKHNIDELQSALAGKSVGFGFSNGTDSFNLSGGTTPRDLDLQLKVLAALLTDPGYRPEGVARVRVGIDNLFQSLDSTPGQVLGIQQGRILSDNDPRFAFPTKEEFYAKDFESLEAAIGDRRRNGALEVALVGDLDEDAAIAAVAATFGALPEREAEFLPREEARIRAFTKDRSVRELTHAGEPDKAIIRRVWPTTDNRDLKESISLRLLARMVNISLTDRLREDLGKAYSPTADANSSRHFRNYGTLSLTASIDVEEINPTSEAIDKVIADLLGAGINADLVQRARKPYLENIDNALKSLGGWMGLVSRAQSQPQYIDRFLSASGIAEALTPEDLQATARKYLQSDDAVTIIVAPQGPSTCEGETGCATPATSTPTAE